MQSCRFLALPFTSIASAPIHAALTLASWRLDAGCRHATAGQPRPWCSTSWVDSRPPRPAGRPALIIQKQCQDSYILLAWKAAQLSAAYCQVMAVSGAPLARWLCESINERWKAVYLMPQMAAGCWTRCCCCCCMPGMVPATTL